MARNPYNRNIQKLGVLELYRMEIIGSDKMAMMTTIEVWNKWSGHASRDKLSHPDFVKNAPSNTNNTLGDSCVKVK